MNLSQFFEHWQIQENPFRGEEARHDAVFARMAMRKAAARKENADPATPSTPAARRGDVSAYHSDFEKIIGELAAPATAVVFGEKGSGKTAIRMQIADELARHNARHPDARVFLVPYDDLNAELDHLHAGSGHRDPLESIKGVRLADHMDAMLSVGVTRLVDALLREDDAGEDLRTIDTARLGRTMRKRARRELLLLQAIYDRHPLAHERTDAVRRLLRLPTPPREVWSRLLAYGGWVLPVAVLAAFFTIGGGESNNFWIGVFSGAVAAWGVFLLKRLFWDRLVRAGIARRLSRQLRMLDRPEPSLAESLEYLDTMLRQPSVLPVQDSEEQRYELFDALRRVLRELGFTGILVVVDRVDEPTLVAGDAERMRALVWPLFNNKFLQQDRFGVKMLLPIELRHALFKESASFFQEARLDKQNLIERLTWTGAMLYDLCDARLQACRSPGAEPITLRDLFTEDVARQDIVDALNQMHQPRDAFKFLYQCLVEHCSNVTAEEGQWQVPRLVLEHVRKEQADRVQQLHRGIRPA
ncbi:MAG: hypothetical protein EA378_02525 [Phycisphaerales bacterium]|nr:MAG: hypothetical protein EA378_02525 [Phycisphaerales bacterium]